MLAQLAAQPRLAYAFVEREVALMRRTSPMLRSLRDRAAASGRRQGWRVAAVLQSPAMRIPPPPAAPRRTVEDEYFGERVDDPYRWLEEASEENRAWTEAQNAFTRAILDELSDRPSVAARLRELLGVPLVGTPKPRGGRLFHLRREGQQAQAVLYVRDGISGVDRVIVDPNALDAESLLTCDWFYPSPDGRRVAYGLSRGGTEQSTLKVLDVGSGDDLRVAIPFTQRGQVAWAGDGFYYTVHPRPGSVPPGDEHYHRHVRHHRLEDDTTERDELVFGKGRSKEDIVGVQASPGGRWVLLTAYQGWARSELYLLDREHPERGTATVVEGVDGLTNGTLDRDVLWLRTNIGAPNYRIARAPCERPAEWTTVVAESADPIEEFDAARGHLIVHRLDRAISRLEVWRKDGTFSSTIELPGPGAVAATIPGAGAAADPETDLACFVFQSFTSPPRAMAVDLPTGRTHELDRAAKVLNSELVTEQVTYPSRDQTDVSMFLVHRRDVRPTGDVPSVITGYGGFSVSRTPSFSAGAVLWAERGGLFALPNLRGGGEYGEAWHRAGMLGNKQNVFDDFHAAAEHLIAAGWTTPRRLGAFGGSNGGLLMGAALTQRPELFGAIVCAVPLLDMLRYQNVLIARYWIPEYGSSDDPEAFRWLRAYSPYHNVRRAAGYPPVLLTTAEGDSRVDPMHARKMAALLQSDSGAELVLLRVDADAGHGVGKPLAKQVEDLADQWSFLAWRLADGRMAGPQPVSGCRQSTVEP
ncbi:prolyl oligopeptidase family serine peptidase [soil metagenome]